MAENDPAIITEPHKLIAEIEQRVQMIEAKVAQAEAAYNNFIRSSEDNPFLRMALTKFGLTNDGTNS